jgi:hypothetical protein
MTTQFDFSNDEWDDLAAAPVLVGMAVAKAEDSGFLGNRREARALNETLAAEAARYPASSLIAQAATTDISQQHERYDTALPEMLATLAVDACQRITAVLAQRAEPEESEAFRRWVLDVGRSVAEAAKEDGVLVSPGEAALLAEVAAALGLSAG